MALKPEHITVHEAAEMTQRCHVHYNKRYYPENRWTAKLWCHSIGGMIIGKGPTVLEAVLDAYNKDHVERMKKLGL